MHTVWYQPYNLYPLNTPERITAIQVSSKGASYSGIACTVLADGRACLHSVKLQLGLQFNGVSKHACKPDKRLDLKRHEIKSKFAQIDPQQGVQPQLGKTGSTEHPRAACLWREVARVAQSFFLSVLMSSHLNSGGIRPRGLAPKMLPCISTVCIDDSEASLKAAYSQANQPPESAISNEIPIHLPLLKPTSQQPF
eukprot:1139430-Pelagomonas_calceolata.AAC.3